MTFARRAAGGDGARRNKLIGAVLNDIPPTQRWRYILPATAGGNGTIVYATFAPDLSSVAFGQLSADPGQVTGLNLNGLTVSNGRNVWPRSGSVQFYGTQPATATRILKYSTGRRGLLAALSSRSLTGGAGGRQEASLVNADFTYYIGGATSTPQVTKDSKATGVTTVLTLPTGTYYGIASPGPTTAGAAQPPTDDGTSCVIRAAGTKMTGLGGYWPTNVDGFPAFTTAEWPIVSNYARKSGVFRIGPSSIVTEMDCDPSSYAWSAPGGVTKLAQLVLVTPVSPSFTRIGDNTFAQLQIQKIEAWISAIGSTVALGRNVTVRREVSTKIYAAKVDAAGYTLGAVLRTVENWTDTRTFLQKFTSPGSGVLTGVFRDSSGVAWPTGPASGFAFDTIYPYGNEAVGHRGTNIERIDGSGAIVATWPASGALGVFPQDGIVISGSKLMKNFDGVWHTFTQTGLPGGYTMTGYPLGT